jgi:hypothetical protein
MISAGSQAIRTWNLADAVQQQGGTVMKVLIAVIASLLIAAPALAQRKDCNELKAEIDAKIQKNGVKEFTTTIVPNEEVNDGMGAVVFICDGGTKKIVYKRGG